MKNITLFLRENKSIAFALSLLAASAFQGCKKPEVNDSLTQNASDPGAMDQNFTELKQALSDLTQKAYNGKICGEAGQRGLFKMAVESEEGGQKVVVLETGMNMPATNAPLPKLKIWLNSQGVHVLYFTSENWQQPARYYIVDQNHVWKKTLTDKTPVLPIDYNVSGLHEIQVHLHRTYNRTFAVENCVRNYYGVLPSLQNFIKQINTSFGGHTGQGKSHIVQ